MKIVCVLLCVSLVGCSHSPKAEPEASELAGARVVNEAVLTRFTITKERTDFGCPTLFLIKDTLTGTSYLYLEQVGGNGCTIAKMDTPLL